MEYKTNLLIQAYNEENEEIGLFRFTGNNCPEDYVSEVIKEYFELFEEDEDNADLHLFRWGIERVYIDYEVVI
jgi:SpoVK/Ycf46/Vps4 family AAA+-type ATPase